MTELISPVITFLDPLPGGGEDFSGFKATLSSKSKPRSDRSAELRLARARDYLVGDFVLLEARDSVPITVAEILRVWQETESQSKLVSVCLYAPACESALGLEGGEEVEALDSLVELGCDQLVLGERETEPPQARGGRKRKLALLTSQRIVPNRNIPVVVVTQEQFNNYTQLKQRHGAQFETVCAEPDTRKSLDLSHSQLLAPIFLFCSRMSHSPSILSAFKRSCPFSSDVPRSSLAWRIFSARNPSTSPPYELRSLSPGKHSPQGADSKRNTVCESASSPLRRSERIIDTHSPTSPLNHPESTSATNPTFPLKHSESTCPIKPTSPLKHLESISATKPASPLKHSSPPTSPLKRRKPDGLPDPPCPLSPSRAPKSDPAPATGLTTPPNSPTKHSMCLRNSPKSPVPVTTPHKSEPEEVFKTPRKRYCLPTPPPKKPRLEVVMPDKSNFTSLADLFDYDDIVERRRSKAYVPATSPSRCRESAYTTQPSLDLSCDEELTFL